MRSPRARTLLIALVALLAAVGSFVIPAVSAPSASAATNGIFADDLKPTIDADQDGDAVELGIRFSPDTAGTVTALQYYQGRDAADVTTATLWSRDGRVLAQETFAATSRVGWRSIPLTEPVELAAGKTYIASYHAPKGGYPVIENHLDAPRVQNGFSLKAGAGVYAYGPSGKVPTSSYRGSNYLVDVVYAPNGDVSEKPGEPTPEPTTPPTGEPTPEPTPEPTTPPTTTPPTADPDGIMVLGRSFPSAATTGVPEGTSLSKYTGPCTIQTDNVVIDKKIIDCDMRVLAQNLTITNSVINGHIYSDPDYFNGSYTMTDSEIRMPEAAGTGAGDVNFVLTRVEVTGGSRSVNCAANCTVQDSYLHGQYTDKRGIDHESAIRMGSNSTIRHNTITCDAAPVPPDAGCSAALTGYGDFAIVQKNTIADNLIDGGPDGSMGYCAYGGSTPGKPFSAGVNNIKFTDNIFMRGPSGKCGIWGPITSFDSNAPGNVWTNNVWDDGKPVAPAN